MTLTYPNNTKQLRIDNLQRHMDADELIRGTGFSNGRGCFIGCTLDDFSHTLFADKIGVHPQLPPLLDYIFENASNAYYPTFGIRFLKALPEDVDTTPIIPAIHSYIQKCNLQRVRGLDIDEGLKTQVLEAINGVIACFENDEDIETFERARSAAESARSAAESARSAWWSAAESAAESARSAVRSARSAAESARSAAESARSAAESARSAWSAAESAAESARSAEVDVIAEELIRLVSDLKQRNPCSQPLHN